MASGIERAFQEFPLWPNRIRGVPAAPGCRFHPQPGTGGSKDLMLLQPGQLGSDPWPGISYVLGWPKKKKKKEERKKESDKWYVLSKEVFPPPPTAPDLSQKPVEKF